MKHMFLVLLWLVFVTLLPAHSVDAQSCTGSGYFCWKIGQDTGLCEIDHPIRNCNLEWGGSQWQCELDSSCCAHSGPGCTFASTGPSPTPGGSPAPTDPPGGDFRVTIRQWIHHPDGTKTTKETVC